MPLLLTDGADERTQLHDALNRRIETNPIDSKAKPFKNL